MLKSGTFYTVKGYKIQNYEDFINIIKFQETPLIYKIPIDIKTPPKKD